MNSTRSHFKLCSFGQRMLFRQMVALNRLPNSRCIFGFGKKKAKPKEVAISEVESEVESKFTEEEVMRMRDVSRLPAEVKSQLTGVPPDPLFNQMFQFKTPYIRKTYAMYGRASGIKPGVMWPSKEELEWQKGYEKAFCKPFHELVEELNERKRLEAKAIKEREDDVMTKLKQLPKFKKEFWNKYHQMQDQLREEKAKKEKLIQEVRDFVGYDLDPNDPRFEEALIKKDEEKKKVMKAQKKQEKQKLVLEKLQALANEAMEREKEDQTILDKSKSQSTQSDNK